jgi:CheY-like chemotaxis protein
VSDSESRTASGPADPRPVALIADDEAEVRGLVGEVLADAGFEIVLARDGLELVELAARHRPQLIVADVMMPSMDGYTAVARLRGQAATADIPVIMVTGCTDPAYAELSAGMGACAHLTKPFSPRRLGELAQDMVRRAHV